MAPSTEETAVYVGEAGNCLTDGTQLIPGETIALVGAGEAEASELWKPVKGKPASANPRNSAPGTTTEPDPPAADPPADPPEAGA